MQITANGIKFDGKADSTDFYLYPIKGTHKAKDIQRAKFWLRDKKKAKRIQIRWNLQGDDPPTKIPEQAIISHLQTELGKKESYIQELEQLLAEKQDFHIKPEDLKILKKDEYCIQLKKQISILTQKLGRCRKDTSTLITQIHQHNISVSPGVLNKQEQDEEYLSDT